MTVKSMKRKAKSVAHDAAVAAGAAALAAAIDVVSEAAGNEPNCAPDGGRAVKNRGGSNSGASSARIKS
jgi:hypothetical protein